MTVQDLGLAAGIIGAICWLFSYIFIIRRGFLDKSCGMPFAALCPNIAWEFIFSFVSPVVLCGANFSAHTVPALGYDPFARFSAESVSPGAIGQQIVNMLWFLMDIAIVVTYLRFGRRDFTSLLSQKWFLPSLGAGLVISAVLVYTTVGTFNDCQGINSAFGMNLLMSGLYPILLLERGSIRGQSFYIAATKLLGTAGFSIRFYAVAPENAFLNSQYIFILLFDIVYLVLVLQQCRKEGINPFTRF